MYDQKLADQYLEILENEIITIYQKEKIKTIYIGGGTPSVLNLAQLEKLLFLLDLFDKTADCEITFEINCDSIDEKKLMLLRQKVNRLSFGVQSFNNDLLNYLGRKHSKKVAIEKLKLAKKLGFENISIDLIFGLKNQKISDLAFDIKMIKNLDIQHVSWYSLMLKEETFFCKNENYIDENLEVEMYNYIVDNMKGYIYYEISSFAKQGFFSKHNLVYWDNKTYYGFGMGAVGYDGEFRHENAKNLVDYKNFKVLKEKVTLNEKIQNEFILGLRKISGVSEEEFVLKYGISFLDFPIVKNLIKDGELFFLDKRLFINKKKLYVSNQILVRLLDDYV